MRHGVVVAAYAIETWHGPGGPEGNRWAFEGRRSPELDRRYVSLDMSEYYPRGAQNPVRFLL